MPISIRGGAAGSGHDPRPAIHHPRSTFLFLGSPDPGARLLSVAVATGIGENGEDCEGAAAVTDENRAETRDERHCFRCGRDLGPLGEWKKMDTEAGPICYVCFNEAAAGERAQEPPR